MKKLLFSMALFCVTPIMADDYKNIISIQIALMELNKTPSKTVEIKPSPGDWVVPLPAIEYRTHIGE